MRYLFEDYTLDAERRELHRGADIVPVAPQVFDLLEYLIRNRKRVVSKDDLINAVWNGRSVSDAALTTRLNAARCAIGDSGGEQRLIKTLPRKGFRFVGQVREAREAAGVAEGEAHGGIDGERDLVIVIVVGAADVVGERRLRRLGQFECLGRFQRVAGRVTDVH